MVNEEIEIEAHDSIEIMIDDVKCNRYNVGIYIDCLMVLWNRFKGDIYNCSFI